MTVVRSTPSFLASRSWLKPASLQVVTSRCRLPIMLPPPQGTYRTVHAAHESRSCCSAAALSPARTIRGDLPPVGFHQAQGGLNAETVGSSKGRRHDPGWSSVE